MLARLILPRYCMVCFKAINSDFICTTCVEMMALVDLNAFCIHCSAPLPSAYSGACKDCEGKAVLFDRIIFACRYESCARLLLHRFKYGLDRLCGKVVSARLLAQIQALGFKDYQKAVLLPVPLHHWRLWRRGFNQSQYVAQFLSRKLAIPVQLHLVKRVKHTKPQHRLKVKDRKRNLSCAFEVLKNDVGPVDLAKIRC